MATSLITHRNVEIQRYEPGHAEYILGQDVVATEWLTVRRTHLVSLSAGDAVTLFIKGRPVACFGIVRIWNGYGEAWMILSVEGLRFAKTVYKVVKGLLRFALKHGGYHRIQATVLESLPAGQRLAEHLGFLLEYRIPHAGPNKEALYLYSILVT